MQSIEAMLSLLIFLSIAALAIAADPGPPPIDDGLYRVQLAEDAWRVLYLRGDFKDFRGERGAIEADMETIGGLTGLCLFMDGIEFTNCRGGENPHEGQISLRRTVLLDGNPMTVTFTLSTSIKTFSH